MAAETGPNGAGKPGRNSTKTAPLKKGARITGVAREKLAAELSKKYEKGQSIRSLAEATGRSYGFVHRLLLDSDVTLRGRGGATRSKKK
ncbi:helix-turn-helix domain-containing protein [Nakamurella leprariae]|uniref:helix-turn-helix domain-containing protein n=1 Tax=Nakamurella leprariae TaxID=2803911 RepID=UPI001F2E740A|nr:helix-turn-helix domain-containing protein [Nakamurella leprariae]